MIKKFLQRMPGIRKIKNKFNFLEYKYQALEERCTRLENRDAGLNYRIDDVYHEVFAANQRLEMNYYKLLPVEKYPQEIEEWYLRRTGKKMDIENPVTFNEKIQLIKLYSKNNLMTRLCDKYLVRDWVAKKIGEQYLIPLLGVWSSFEEINFDLLPQKFALKANHGSGMNLIITDKSKMNMEETEKKVREWLTTDYAFYTGFELQYQDVKRKIIAEKYIENEYGNLCDYKVFCFNGQAKYILYVTGRYSETKEVCYDLDWKVLPWGYAPYVQEDIAPKPKKLKEMIVLSEQLSDGFPLVRVDWYVLEDNSLKFGEMTFTPGSGISQFQPDERDKINGELIELDRWINEHQRIDKK